MRGVLGIKYVVDGWKGKKRGSRFEWVYVKNKRGGQGMTQLTRDPSVRNDIIDDGVCGNISGLRIRNRYKLRFGGRRCFARANFMGKRVCEEGR